MGVGGWGGGVGQTTITTVLNILIWIHNNRYKQTELEVSGQFEHTYQFDFWSQSQVGMKGTAVLSHLEKHVPLDAEKTSQTL